MSTSTSMSMSVFSCGHVTNPTTHRRPIASKRVANTSQAHRGMRRGMHRSMRCDALVGRAHTWPGRARGAPGKEMMKKETVEVVPWAPLRLDST